MFNPEYRITETLLKLIEKISAKITEIQGKKIRLPLLSELQKSNLEQSAHYSTSIEGNALSLQQIQNLNRGEDITASFQDKTEALNYLEALRWIHQNIQSTIHIQNICKLHSIVGQSLFEPQKLGVFKNTVNYVINEQKIVVYRPPAPQQCPKLAQELIDWLQHSSSNIHPIILCAITHHQFVSIHPFSDGNGRVARLLSLWVLLQQKFDPHHLLCLDDFFASDQQKYYQKIQQVRELDYDFTYWIEYVAQGVLQTAQKVYKRVKYYRYTANQTITLSPKQEELILLIQNHGPVGSKKLSELLNVNRARVHQLLKPLLKAQIIERQGAARASRYFLGKEI